jgi:hypothetical protein
MPRLACPSCRWMTTSGTPSCAAGAVQIALLKRESFADSQSGPPEQHDQRAETMPLGAVADRTHHGDDLLDRRRVGRVLLALVTRRAASVIARHCRRRAAVPGGVQEREFHESSLGGWFDMRCYSNPAAQPPLLVRGVRQPAADGKREADRCHCHRPRWSGSRAAGPDLGRQDHARPSRDGRSPRSDDGDRRGAGSRPAGHASRPVAVLPAWRRAQPLAVGSRKL